MRKRVTVEVPDDESTELVAVKPSNYEIVEGPFIAVLDRVSEWLAEGETVTVFPNRTLSEILVTKR